MNQVTHHWLKASSIMCRPMKVTLHFQSIFSLCLTESWSTSHPGPSSHPVLALSEVNIWTEQSLSPLLSVQVKHSVNAFPNITYPKVKLFFFWNTILTVFKLVSLSGVIQVNCQESDSRNHTRDQTTVLWLEIQIWGHWESLIYTL